MKYEIMIDQIPSSVLIATAALTTTFCSCHIPLAKRADVRKGMQSDGPCNFITIPILPIRKQNQLETNLNGNRYTFVHTTRTEQTRDRASSRQKQRKQRSRSFLYYRTVHATFETKKSPKRTKTRKQRRQKEIRTPLKKLKSEKKVQS